MASPRTWVAPTGTAGTFHVISRCTRRAWLLHGEHAHRRDWFCGLAGELLTDFRIDLHAYAVMANHVHLVLRPRPDRVAALSAEQIAEAGHRVMPLRGGADRSALPATSELHQRLAQATPWLSEYRQRLGSLSWFMRCLKQRFAMRANAESDCRGHFWESRFHSVPLLDLGAVVGCMVYVDLNPFRAGVADQPEHAPFTSLRARLHGDCLGADEGALAAHLTPLTDAAPVDALTGTLPGCDLQLADYLDLIRAGAQTQTVGTIRAGNLLTSPHAWASCMTAPGRFQGTAVGSAAERSRLATRLGRARIHDATGLYPTTPASCSRRIKDA